MKERNHYTERGQKYSTCGYYREDKSVARIRLGRCSLFTREEFEKEFSKEVRNKLDGLWKKKEGNWYPYCDDINFTVYEAYMDGYWYTKNIGVDNVPKKYFIDNPNFLTDYEVRHLPN